MRKILGIAFLVITILCFGLGSLLAIGDFFGAFGGTAPLSLEEHAALTNLLLVGIGGLLGYLGIEFLGHR